MKKISVNPYILIFILGFLIYGWSLTFGFSYLDDNVLILDNLFYLKKISNIFNAFATEVFRVLHASAAYYRPMLTISFILDAQVSGENPFFYHLTNLLLHISTTIFLFVFLKRLGYKEDTSLLGALIFLVHPLSTQAVAWIPGRNDSLLAFFILPAFIFFKDYVEVGINKSLYLHFIFFLFSLFYKRTCVVICGALSFLYAVYFEG